LSEGEEVGGGGLVEERLVVPFGFHYDAALGIPLMQLFGFDKHKKLLILIETHLPPSPKPLPLPPPIINHLHIPTAHNLLHPLPRIRHNHRILLMLQPRTNSLCRPETPILHIKVLHEVQQSGIALNLVLVGGVLVLGAVELGEFGIEVIKGAEFLQLREEVLAVVAPRGVEVDEEGGVLGEGGLEVGVGEDEEAVLLGDGGGGSGAGGEDQ
jgi:hypothetical protein